MPRRRLLTDAQRADLLALPTREADLARHYSLSPEDLALVATRKRPETKLGLALQLCALRYPGRLLRPGELIPAEPLRFIAEQVGVPPDSLAGFARRGPTRYEQLARLYRAYGYQELTRPNRRALAAWLLPVARGTTAGPALVQALLGEMRRARIVIPGVSAVERLAAAALHDAERDVWSAIVGRLDERGDPPARGAPRREGARPAEPVRVAARPSRRGRGRRHERHPGPARRGASHGRRPGDRLRRAGGEAAPARARGRPPHRPGPSADGAASAASDPGGDHPGPRRGPHRRRPRRPRRRGRQDAHGRAAQTRGRDHRRGGRLRRRHPQARLARRGADRGAGRGASARGRRAGGGRLGRTRRDDHPGERPVPRRPERQGRPADRRGQLPPPLRPAVPRELPLPRGVRVPAVARRDRAVAGRERRPRPLDAGRRARRLHPGGLAAAHPERGRQPGQARVRAVRPQRAERPAPRRRRMGRGLTRLPSGGRPADAEPSLRRPRRAGSRPRGGTGRRGRLDHHAPASAGPRAARRRAAARPNGRRRRPTAGPFPARAGPAGRRRRADRGGPVRGDAATRTAHRPAGGGSTAGPASRRCSGTCTPAGRRRTDAPSWRRSSPRRPTSASRGWRASAPPPAASS